MFSNNSSKPLKLHCMKNPFSFLIIILASLFFISCTKTQMNGSPLKGGGLSANVNPDVPQCNPGQHWDYYLRKCVDNCPTGYHNDSITGACVVDGGSTYISVITNPNNPYDYSGSQHNDGVNSIFPTLNLSTNNLDSVILVDVKSYLGSIGYSADSFQTFYGQAVQNGYLPFSHLQELDSLGNTLNANGVLSTYGNSYVQQIYNYAYQYLNTDTITTAKYNSFANNLITIEATIKNDSRISSWEKEVILASCSNGRYSAAYWGNYINGQSTSGPNSVNPLFLKKLRNWMRFVIADIGGALVAVSSDIHSFWAILGVSVGTSVSAAAGFTY